ncbi:MAG TPA: HupE/UreJ family protein [Candidatus Methylomirabilis sp.]|nr:HupE/UreJ family protein [Candidatus Methylomirabilis sp.]
MKRGYQILTALAALLAANAAQAHIISAQGAGFAAGFAHPFSGLDHLLAMVAVGLWAAQLGGRARWIVPLAFMGAMAAGAALALAGVQLPAVESGIASSVMMLGLLIALAARLPTLTSAILVGAFAVFHGHAHGTELPQAASEALYGAGFLLATGLLHATGLGLGALMHRRLKPVWLRALGGGIAAIGAAMWAII